MTERLAHFLLGWAQVEIQGSWARFLNGAARSGWEFWGFQREGDRVFVRCRAREYKQLRPLARRWKVRLRLRGKGGLPFYTARLKKRKGLAAGVLCGAVVYWFLSGFYWGVTVTGAETLTPAQVLAAAAENGVIAGASRRGLDPDMAARALQNDLPGVSWLAVNTDGCFLEISLRESLEAPSVEGDDHWSNLVAARAGTVLSVEAERGRPLVRAGDTVEEGQLLVTGLYAQEEDPYSPPPAEPHQILGPARGSVRALTYREFTVEVSARQGETIPVGEVQRQASLVLFGVRIPLGFFQEPEGPCRSWKEIKAWTPLGRALPLVWEEQYVQPLAERERTLSPDQLREAALLALRRGQKKQLPVGSKVVEESLSFTVTEEGCVLRAQCRCQEEIGMEQRIEVN